jgi:hypothetical protein
MSDLLITSALAGVFAVLYIYLLKFFWAFINWTADTILRYNKFDVLEQYESMVDYVPIWCIFTGTDHLPPIPDQKMIRRKNV